MRLELDRLLEEKITNPSLDLVSYPRGKLIIDTTVKLISTE
jgi:ATP-dependent RNA helicase DHX57